MPHQCTGYDWRKNQWAKDMPRETSQTETKKKKNWKNSTEYPRTVENYRSCSIYIYITGTP